MLLYPSHRKKAAAAPARCCSVCVKAVAIHNLYPCVSGSELLTNPGTLVVHQLVQNFCTCNNKDTSTSTRCIRNAHLAYEMYCCHDAAGNTERQLLRMLLPPLRSKPVSLSSAHNCDDLLVSHSEAKICGELSLTLSDDSFRVGSRQLTCESRQRLPLVPRMWIDPLVLSPPLKRHHWSSPRMRKAALLPA